MLLLAGCKRLSGILGVSAEQASQFQDSFLQTYREVQAFIQRTILQCHKQGLCTVTFPVCLLYELLSQANIESYCSQRNRYWIKHGTGMSV